MARLCRRWGGRMRLFHTSTAFYDYIDENDGASEAPFAGAAGIGFNWEKKEILAFDCAVVGRIGGLIHEMGHIFASPSDPDGRHPPQEFDFFGWEISVAKMLGVFDAWSASNGNYVITESGTTWAQCGAVERKCIVEERTDVARRIGLLDRWMRPVAIR